MGEYAKYKGIEIKIGTCNRMYYLTLNDREKVDYKFNLNNLYVWRLPELGNYKEPGDGELRDWRNTCKTIINSERFWEVAREKYSEEELDDMKYTLQICHDCGYLVNIPCYHGRRLPDNSKDVKIFWNGMDGNMLRMSGIVTIGKRAMIEISCRHCDKSFTISIDELKYVLTNSKGDWLFGEGTKKYYEKIVTQILEYEKSV